jgi:hypothetical protein
MPSGARPLRHDLLFFGLNGSFRGLHFLIRYTSVISTMFNQIPDVVICLLTPETISQNYSLLSKISTMMRKKGVPVWQFVPGR